MKKYKSKAEITGFTLIEMMIVIALISIMMVIAVPSYNQHIEKSRRTEAMSALMDLSNRQQQFMLDRNTYSNSLTNIGIESDMTEFGNYILAISTESSSCPLISCFELTATPVEDAQQINDKICTKFILSSSTSKTSEGLYPGRCW